MKVSKSKKGLSLTGCCTIAAFIAMMFYTSTVQAAAWMVNGTNIVSASSIIATAEIEPYELEKKTKLNVLTLLSEVASGSIWITCSEVESSSLFFKGEGVATGAIEFNNCNTYLNGKISTPCRPQEPIFANSVLTIVLHEGKPYVKVTGATGGVFTQIVFTEECAVGEEFEVTGSIWLEDANGKFSVEELTHLVQEAKGATKSLGGLFYGSHSAVIDGSAWTHVFSGLFEMAKFSGLAS
jgi:hypothetical protein